MDLTEEQKQAIDNLTQEEREVIVALGKLLKYTSHFRICDGAEGMCMFWNVKDRTCLLRSLGCMKDVNSILGFYKAIIEE